MTNNPNQVSTTQAAENYYKNLVNGYFSDQIHLISKQLREAEDSDLINNELDLLATRALFRVQFLQALKATMEHAYVAVTEQMEVDIAHNRMLDDLCPLCGAVEIEPAGYCWTDEGEIPCGVFCLACGYDSEELSLT
jgi:hypothetical protein